MASACETANASPATSIAIIGIRTARPLPRHAIRLENTSDRNVDESSGPAGARKGTFAAVKNPHVPAFFSGVFPYVGVDTAIYALSGSSSLRRPTA